MPLSTHRVLKRRGKVSLIENGNPATGIGYSVRKESEAIWNGPDLDEAKRQFETASERGRT